MPKATGRSPPHVWAAPQDLRRNQSPRPITIRPGEDWDKEFQTVPSPAPIANIRPIGPRWAIQNDIPADSPGRALHARTVEPLGSLTSSHIGPVIELLLGSAFFRRVIFNDVSAGSRYNAGRWRSARAHLGGARPGALGGTDPMTRGILKLLSPSPTTIGRCSSFTFVGLVTAVVLASATPAVAIVTLDQETGADRYPSGLRVATFFPVGQTFVPTRSLHVGVELLLSMSCSETAPLPPAIYTVLLRERSLAGPVLASGTTPAFTCPELSDPARKSGRPRGS